MFILGLQGSPRLKGNTNYLIDRFLDAAKNKGARTEKLNVARMNILPCIGCGTCERKGVCAIRDDDMSVHIYPLLRRADVIVLASPVYFYNVPAVLKALIDRTQALWSRKYKLGMDDPGRGHRKGVMLTVGATKGKNLFDGMVLTAKYFFDAIGADYIDMLGYRRIEEPGEMEKQAGVEEDITMLLNKIEPVFTRRKILFACRENACRSQMASAFAKMAAGDRIEALYAGSTPAKEINPDMVKVMAEVGIDMAYRVPRSIQDVLEEATPDTIITMGCGDQCPYIPGVTYEDWDLPDPAGRDLDFMRKIRDEIRQRVGRLMA
jgi:arsenate reductase (thioredoxin)